MASAHQEATFSREWVSNAAHGKSLGKNLSFPTRISVPYFVLNSPRFTPLQIAREADGSDKQKMRSTLDFIG